MKKSKLLLGLILSGIIIAVGTGCGKTQTESKNEESKKETVTKLSAWDCIKKIEIGSSIEEIEEIVGVKGVEKEEGKGEYDYDLQGGTDLKVKFTEGKASTITVEYEQNTLKDSKVDLSNMQDLKDKVKNGITYEEFKNEIGGADGYMYEKSSYTTRYIWVSKTGGNIKASFRTSDDKCTFFTGYGK